MTLRSQRRQLAKAELEQVDNDSKITGNNEIAEKDSKADLNTMDIDENVATEQHWKNIGYPAMGSAISMEKSAMESMGNMATVAESEIDGKGIGRLSWKISIDMNEDKCGQVSGAFKDVITTDQCPGVLWDVKVNTR